MSPRSRLSRVECILKQRVQGFIQTPWVWGEIASIGGCRWWGSGGCAPSGVQGQSPWSGGLGGQAPQKLGAFCCVSSWFLYVLKATVERQHLYCTCVTMIGIVWIACTLWTIKRWQHIYVITLENLDRFLEFLTINAKRNFLDMYERCASHLNTLCCENETSHFIPS